MNKVISSIIFVVALGGFWAWMNLRVQVLRKAGAPDFARRQYQRNAITLGGLLVVLIAVTWVPHGVRGWVALFGFVGIVGGLGFVMVRDMRQAVQGGRQHRSTEE